MSAAFHLAVIHLGERTIDQLEAPAGRGPDVRLSFHLVEPDPSLPRPAAPSPRPAPPPRARPTPPPVPAVEEPRPSEPPRPDRDEATGTEVVQPAPDSPSPPPPTLAGGGDPRRPPAAGVAPRGAGAVVVGKGLPLQPSVDQLFTAVEGARSLDEHLAAAAGSGRRGPAPALAHAELRGILSGLEEEWASSSRDRLQGGVAASLSDVAKVFAGGRPQWERQYREWARSLPDPTGLPLGPMLDDRTKSFSVGTHLEAVAAIEHNDDGSVASVVVVESSGDPSFDAWLQAMVLRRGNQPSETSDGRSHLRSSRLRFLADVRVAVPTCGSVEQLQRDQKTGPRLDHEKRAACNFAFDERGFVEPLSRSYSSQVVLEEAELRTP